MTKPNNIFSPFLLIWIAVCVVLVVTSWSRITSGIGWDPDDQLRLVQLRDWMGGQSWFDTVQYRIGEPDSQPMHWSRLIEVPLALIIWALSPLTGTANAEIAAMIIVPLICVGLVMAMVMKITNGLFARQPYAKSVGLLAAALTATAIPALMQLRPMRIDHHGWQIVLALASLWTMFWPDKRKGGIALGVFLALWLSISLEGLPLSLAFIALLVWRWIVSAGEGIRLFWALAGFLLMTILLYFINHGQSNPAINYCDAISPAHLFACLAGAAVMLPALYIRISAMALRLGALAIAAIAALAVFYLSAPQCLGSAFTEMNPLVRDYWLVYVKEGRPVWDQSWTSVIGLFGGSMLVGLVSLVYIAKKAPSAADREAIFFVGYAFIWSFIVALFVQRAASIASIFAMPFVAWAVHHAFLKARAIQKPVLRILATASVVFLVIPGPLVLALADIVYPEAEDKNVEPSKDDPQSCHSSQSLQRINALPRANIVAPMDYGPEILLISPHNVLATGHHRNDKAMADQIRAFTSPPAQSRAILEAHNIDYIIACADDAELSIYKGRNPEGLWAALSTGTQPDWLHPVHIRDSKLQVWRVVREEPVFDRNGM